MKYKAGDKFTIEINRVFGTGLYLIKGFNALVFDDYGLDKLVQVHEHDGCDECEHFSKCGDEYPCNECKQNYKDKWTPKAEEIQVGDEVEHLEGIKGIVIDKEYDKRMYLRVLKNQKAHYIYWLEENCTRTGKTYPELIKALEGLPKEGE